MVYHIGPTLPASQTSRPKPVRNAVNTDVTVNKQGKSTSGPPLVERRKKNRRHKRQDPLMDMRSGRDRRKQGQPGGLEVEV